MLFLGVMVIDLVIPFVIAIPYKGYSHTNQVMSVLGCENSPWGIIYNLWMIASGVIFPFFGYRIFLYYENINFGVAITIFLLLSIYGFGDEIISGLFPLNEKKEDVTVSSKTHRIGSAIGFVALQFSNLFLAILGFNSGDIVLGWISFIFFILSLISFIFFAIGNKPKFKDSLFSLGGLWQRVLCLLMYIPFIVWIIM
ncbi:DUF998 domain-containing protein [Clostridium chauvoei]|nr:DUF998 domain-containing protein [Clostridium chauvoei]ATD56178.1 hypothetical protein BTM20_03490 [Clostridium chauvoei]ATD58723.1 hypothetical protein BTM21_09570 [Clostridium chauvoei]MBX7279765.1 DUF998 domain-containing protein [Clostridium chauvoei]MBX7282134.1 DUF998 domain-containing protein [Clostridium chauvoei]MBX7284656.1 DUF998 domain-containing protein [Clostridium chauvoei]